MIAQNNWILQFFYIKLDFCKRNLFRIFQFDRQMDNKMDHKTLEKFTI